MAVRSGFRFPEPLYHALFCRLTVHDGRNPIAQQGEHGDEQQHGGDGISVAVEPIGVFQKPTDQRIDGGRQQPGNQPGPQRIQQSLPYQHGFQLPPGLPYGLQNGKFPPPGQDGGHHGVEEIQDAHNADDGAQQSAQNRKGHLELPEMGTLGRLAFVCQGTSRGIGEPGKIAFRRRFRLGSGGVKEVEHGEDIVRSHIPAQRIRTENCLIAHGVEQMEEKSLLGELLTQPHFLEGQIFVDILRRCNKYQNDQISNAKQASREYREYIDSWVHEIKTPITSARLMIENEKNPITLRIDDELRKIDTYVEQVLYYARSTDVEKDFKVEKTTLQSLVHAALKTYSKPLIQAGGKPVLNGLDIPVVADSKSCTFVIGQIISNAIKYRKDNLQIEFSAKAEKNDVSLFISDNGIGISAADLPRVFDKGFTGENGRRYSKSTGIGLYLSQKLCKKMNIVLSVSSEPGQGTTVTMVFPTESYLKEAGL